MARRGMAIVMGVAGIVSLCALAVSAQTPVTTAHIATGLDQPVFVTSPAGDVDRLFVVEQRTGQIRIINLGDAIINGTSFLTVTGLARGGEQGLLGLAFHPDYAASGFLYVNFTATDGTTHIRRYTASSDPDLADPASALTILTYSQPANNHNGGWLGFGPDGYLYIATGDGGGGNDSGPGHTALTGNAQDITDNLLGKILRLDVDGNDFPLDASRNYAIPPDNPFVGVSGDDEIWAYGLRNPWRASFDRLTGDFYIGDVGQNAREEVNVQRGSSFGGENYGWRLREGMIATPGFGGAQPRGAIDPIYDYSRGGGTTQGSTVIGGYVYRGPNAELDGIFFFADRGSDRIWSFRYDGSDATAFDGTNHIEFADRTRELAPDVGTLSSVSSFGEDGAGQLYIVHLGGDVFRIVGGLPGEGDGDVDLAEIRGDLDGDGDVDLADYLSLAACLGGPGVRPLRACCGASPRRGACIAPADLDHDNDVDLGDLFILQAAFTGSR